jgi:predicted PurR-regulated permease PerM
MSDERRARWSTPTFLVAFGAVLFLLAWISIGFLFPLALAMSAAVVLGRVNERLVRALRGRRGLAALLMSVGTFLGIFAPLGFILVMLLQAAIPLIDRGVELFASGELGQWAQARMPEQLTSLVDPAQVRENVGGWLAGVGSALGGFVAQVPKMLANVTLHGLVAFLALFVYFARGPQLVTAIVEATPMERRHTRALLSTVAAAIRTVFAASFITALIQFALGYLGFRLVGVPMALGLAAVMGFLSFIFSLVPVLGSGLVWGPVGLTLLLTGRPIAGIFVFAWGALVLGSVDNVVKPLYAKGQLQLSPLLVFITLFGGIAVFGPIGALLGPLIAALAAAFLRIWTTEFLPDSEELPRPRRPGGRKQGKLARAISRLKLRWRGERRPAHAH